MKLLLAFNAAACGFNAALLTVPGHQDLNLASAIVSAATTAFLIWVMRTREARHG